MLSFGMLQVRDFGPFGSADLNLRNQGLTLICGVNKDTTAASSNGSGKSHLLKAILWVLFGNTIEGDKTDEVIRKGCKLASVALEWEDEGHTYDLVRTRNKTLTTLELRIDGEDKSGITLKDTQDHVNELIGMDFQSFTNTVLYGQGDIRHFADPATKDPERKAVLKRLLRLEALDTALKYVKQKLSDAEKKHARLTSTLPVLEAKRDGIRLEVWDARIAELSGRASGLAGKTVKKPRLEGIKTQIEGVLAGYETTKKQITDLDKLRLEADRASANERGNATAAKAAAQAARNRMKLFQDGKCPTCGADGDSIAAEMDSLAQEVAAAEEVERQHVAKAAEHAKTSAAHTASIRSLRMEIADETDWRSRLTATSVELKGIEQAVAQARTVEADIKREQTAKDAKAAERSKIEAEIAATAKQLEEAESEVAHANFCVRMFGNQGLPSYIMDTITPEFQERTNDYLRLLTDGDIVVQFDTESKLKGGEARDKFSVEAVGPDINGRPSTGQQKKINIAADLGLMTLAASRERSGIDLLLLDEILDGLDAAGKARVVDLLQELRKTRSSIFVISHDPSLAEIFENVITVTKEGGEASLS